MTDSDFDVVIVGSGGGGLAGALAASECGARVTVIEGGEKIGGTFAYSAGLVWVPNNHMMAQNGYQDSADEALSHVRELSGGRHDDEVLQSFIQNSPAVIRWLTDEMNVPFDLLRGYADYYSERTGGKEAGRYLSSPTFKAKELLSEEWRSVLATSPHFAGLPASWLEIEGWGGLASMKSWDWNEMARRLGEDYRTFGSATIGYMLVECLKRNIPIQLRTWATELITSEGRVIGVRVRTFDGTESILYAEKGVLLATGGYDSNEHMKNNFDLFPRTKALGSPNINGSGLAMALDIGAGFQAFDGQLTTPTYNIPGEEADGRPLFRSAVREPAFPGGIVINSAGRRFADESFYRSLCHEMAHWDVRTQSFPNERAHLIFDQEWKDSYAIGPVSPGETPEWIVSADSTEELAKLIDVDAPMFGTTVERYNSTAKNGLDPEFGRGSMLYSRRTGDENVKPNPCIRPLVGRLYAVPLYLGSSGTNGGLIFDRYGRVMSLQGRVIPGLYLAGNLGAHLIEGLWYNSGVSNAKALTFGYLGVRHMFGKTSSGERDNNA